MRIPVCVVLSAACIACDSGGPANGPPANIAKTAGDASQGVVAQAVSPAPAVKVTDDQSRPVPGVTVTFAVATGGGSVSGQTPATDAQGIATVGAWTLGNAAGANTLTATAASLNPVTFTATGVAGPAATMSKTSTDGQESHVGSQVSPRPAVRLRDSFGNDVAAASVTFAVASGGGSASGTTGTTDATGTATVGSWTLGANPGTNTMTASRASITPVTFTMTGVDMCARAPSYTIGTSSAGALGTGDCLLSSGQYTDKFTITSGGVTTFRLDQKSTVVDSRLVLFSQPDNRLVQSGPAGLDAQMTVTAGAGSFIAGASSVNTGATGAYTLESTNVAEDVTGCSTRVLVNSPTTNQTVQTSDCADNEASGTYYFDAFVFFVEAGKTYQVSMATSAFNPFIEIQTLAGSPTNFASASGSGTRTARSTFTPTVTEHRFVLASTVNIGQTGAYTLSIAITAPTVVAGAEVGTGTLKSRFAPDGTDFRRVLQSFRSFK